MTESSSVDTLANMMDSGTAKWRKVCLNEFNQLMKSGSVTESRVYVLRLVDNYSLITVPNEVSAFERFRLSLIATSRKYSIEKENILAFIKDLLFSTSANAIVESFSSTISSSMITDKLCKTKRQCGVCFKWIHKNSFRRHQQTQHKDRPQAVQAVSVISPPVMAIEVQNSTPKRSKSTRVPSENDSSHTPSWTEFHASSDHAVSLSFESDSSSDEEMEERQQLSIVSSSSRAKIMMETVDISQVQEFKELIYNTISSSHNGQKESKSVYAASILLTLRRLIPVIRKHLKKDSSVQNCILLASNTDVLKDYFRQFERFSRNANSRRNEAKKLSFIVRNLVLLQTAPFEVGRNEASHRAIDFLSKLGQSFLKQNSLQTIEELKANGKWIDIKEIREKLRAIQESEIDPALECNLVSLDFARQFESFIFLKLLFWHRPQRTAVYQSLTTNQLTYDEKTETYLVTKTDFKTSKVYKVLHLNLNRECSKHLKVWIEQYRPLFPPKENQVFLKPVKVMCKAIHANLSVTKLRHTYRSILKTEILDLNTLHIMDEADCHSGLTANTFYTHESLADRKTLTKKADELYLTVFDKYNREG